MSNGASVLHQIAESVAKRLEVRKQNVNIDMLKTATDTARRPRPFSEAFRHAPAVIAEIKFKSPSEGVLNTRLKAPEVAHRYLANGAAALSVLTEQDYFNGSYKNLRAIRSEFPDAFILMKDFIIDEYQLYEALTLGADCILLIAALLDPDKLRGLFSLASTLGLSVLVEVHHETEMTAAIDVGATLIGVNNRDLLTLKTSLDISRRLVKLAPPSATLICESGIGTLAQIQEFTALGFKGFLVGTSLMRQIDPGQALKELLGAK